MDTWTDIVRFHKGDTAFHTHNIPFILIPIVCLPNVDILVNVMKQPIFSFIPSGSLSLFKNSWKDITIQKWILLLCSNVTKLGSQCIKLTWLPSVQKIWCENWNVILLIFLEQNVFSFIFNVTKVTILRLSHYINWMESLTHEPYAIAYLH